MIHPNRKTGNPSKQKWEDRWRFQHLNSTSQMHFCKLSLNHLSYMVNSVEQEFLLTRLFPCTLPLPPENTRKPLVKLGTNQLLSFSGNQNNKSNKHTFINNYFLLPKWCFWDKTETVLDLMLGLRHATCACYIFNRRQYLNIRGRTFKS